MAASGIVLLLRFRDLANPEPGHTVRQHRSISRVHGHSWWAWWRKQSEAVPYALWSRIAKQLPTRAYLVDSGTRTLYRTSLLEIRSDPSSEALPAPEAGAKTPAYYATSRFPTWFRIGHIEDAEASELESLAYLEPPHDDLVAFDPAELVNCRIAGIEQLLQFGNVTYWVATDDVARAQPARRAPVRTRLLPPIAPREIVRVEHPVVLHLSDLHFSSAHHAFSVGGLRTSRPTMASAIHQSLPARLQPGLVVVTGDLTWTGAAAEFSLALEALDALRSMLGLSRNDFVIIPGNHDIQWTQIQQEQGYDRLAHPAVSSAEARRNYADFFSAWYGIGPNAYLSIGRRFFVRGGPTLDVLGVSSSELEQIPGIFSGVGRITTEAFKASAEQLEWREDHPRATQLRLLAVHHHLLPVNPLEDPRDVGRGFGIALDAESQLLRAAQYGVDLILHGHQHQPFAGFTKRQRIEGPPLSVERGLLVLGCGSTGVTDEHLGSLKRRAFNLLELTPAGAVVTHVFAASEGFDFRALVTLKGTVREGWARADG